MVQDLFALFLTNACNLIFLKKKEKEKEQNRVPEDCEKTSMI